jgi:hypothetical protein
VAASSKEGSLNDSSNCSFCCFSYIWWSTEFCFIITSLHLYRGHEKAISFVWCWSVSHWPTEDKLCICWRYDHFGWPDIVFITYED